MQKIENTEVTMFALEQGLNVTIKYLDVHLDYVLFNISETDAESLRRERGLIQPSTVNKPDANVVDGQQADEVGLFQAIEEAVEDAFKLSSDMVTRFFN